MSASKGSSAARVGVVGARGYVGAELLRLLDSHRLLDLAFVSSRQLDGEPVAAHVAGFSDDSLRFESLEADAVAERDVDVIVLALPNGLAHEYVDAIDARRGRDSTTIIDVSADFRFDDNWAYGLPERARRPLRGARRIANPGCYATGMQLAIAPLLEIIDGSPAAFGVSGYSGAGTSPSDKNDLEKLRNNLLPYALVKHLHEREASYHLGRRVDFMPHVAPFFRGISLTISMPLREPLDVVRMESLYRDSYADEPLVRVCEGAPLVRDIANKHHVEIGGFAIDLERPRAVVVATIDNLLKGAATQAVQNLNLALEIDDELEGIRPWLR